MKNKAKFKYNNGLGALLCSRCNKIIKTGTNFTDDEWKALGGKLYMEPQYCDECKKYMDNGGTTNNI